MGDPRDGQLVPVPQAPDLLAMLDKAIDRGVSVDQLGKLFDLIERRDAKAAAEAFAAAITGFQAECPQIKKERIAKGTDGGKFQGFTYASLDDIDAVVRPLLTRWGIVVSFTMGEVTNNLLPCTCRVRVGTHVEETTLAVPIPPLTANDTQKFGAACSYVKRYTFCAALNIVISDEDDDATKLGFVTADEAAELEALVAEKERTEGLNRIKFFEFIKATAFDQINRTDYAKAKDMVSRYKKPAATIRDPKKTKEGGK